MATTIKLRRTRKTSTEISELQDSDKIALCQGEPFYNITEKRLYIGDENGELVEDKIALNDIIPLDAENTSTVSFQIGPNENNRFSRSITDVDNLINFENTSSGSIVSFKWGETLNHEFSHSITTIESAQGLQTSRAIDGVLFDGKSHIHHLFICNSSAEDSTKLATAYISSGEPTEIIYDEEVGARVLIWFTNKNSAVTTPPTYLKLQIDNKPAHIIRYRGNPLSTASFEENGIYEFVFTGSYYDLITPL